MKKTSHSVAGKFIQQTLWSLIGACVVGYFMYHTIHGDRGWFAMVRARGEVAAAEETLAKLRKERMELKHRTSLMTNSMDPDLLEEKSRELLNYSKPNEYVVMDPQSSNGKDDGEGGE